MALTSKGVLFREGGLLTYFLAKFIRNVHQCFRKLMDIRKNFPYICGIVKSKLTFLIMLLFISLEYYITFTIRVILYLKKMHFNCILKMLTFHMLTIIVGLLNISYAFV